MRTASSPDSAPRRQPRTLSASPRLLVASGTLLCQHLCCRDAELRRRTCCEPFLPFLACEFAFHCVQDHLAHCSSARTRMAAQAFKGDPRVRPSPGGPCGMLVACIVARRQGLGEEDWRLTPSHSSADQPSGSESFRAGRRRGCAGGRGTRSGGQRCRRRIRGSSRAAGRQVRVVRPRR